MIHIFVDGISAFQNHFWMILSFLLVIVWGWFITQVLLVKIFADHFTDAEYFSLSSAGFIFSLMLWAGLFFCIHLLFGKTIAIAFSIILFFIPILFIKIKKISASTIVLILFFLLSLVLRLAFLTQATLPSYFDSAEHYRILQYFLDVYENDATTSLFLSNYYHAGYHFLLSSIVYIFQLDIPNAMLVFGQIVLAILPISFFIIFKQETQSNLVAFFACAIAGFGFHMPAHLVNWGKYPALLSLLGMQFIFFLIYVVLKKNLFQNKIYGLIIFSAFITAIIHTRTIIVFVFLLLAYLFLVWKKRLSNRLQSLIFGLVFLALGIEVFYLQQSPVLSPLLTGYTQRDAWTLILVLALIPFSIKAYPNSTFFLLASLFLFILALFFPISLFKYGTQTLLDRPFVQMLAYFPLVALASFGFAGLLQILQKFQNANLLTFISACTLFCFLFFNAKFNYSFYPSDCCQLASQDDLSAITWIDRNLPVDAKILIASSRLYVTSYESSQTLAGADAGIWITPLTTRVTNLAPAELNFEIAQTYTDLCTRQIYYIFVGSMPQSFNASQLAGQPNWYHPVLILLNASIYQINCK